MTRIEYQDVAPNAAEDAAVTATGADSESNPALLPFGSGNSGNFAALEDNFWTLDGSMEIHDDEGVALWSSSLSGANCSFSTPPTVTVTFDSRYTSLGISLTFHGDSWCDDLNIKWYQGNTLLADEDFIPDGLQYFCDEAVTAYDKVVITFNRMTLPYRRLRLDRILFGIVRVFDRSEIGSGSIKVVQEIDPTSRTLAANTLDWTLRSKSPVEYMFQFRQPVVAYDNDSLVGIFYIDDAKRIGGRIYDIACEDAIGIMDADPFPDTAYTSITNAYTLAQTICAGYPLEMESSLQSKTVKGVLVGCTRRQALQQLCFAIGAVADTSGSNSIKIYRLPTSNAKVIPPTRKRVGMKVTTEPIVTQVNLTAHSYSTRSSAGAEEITINGTKYYDAKTVTTINNPDATATDKPNVVSVDNATLISPSNVAEIAQLLYDEVSRRDIASFKFHVDGEVIGDLVEATTAWGDTVEGHYVKATLTLSSFVLSDAEVRGT